jgi:DNA end-binding protein Ku
MPRRRARADAPDDVRDDAGDEGPDGARARAFWSGTISFGLVSVPVALFPATRALRASLRMLAPDGTPLERRWYCARDERNVAWDELVRGFELEDGSFVVMSDEEIEAAAPEKSRDIDLRRFVPSEALDPVYFERGYFLVPAGESTKAYRLLAEAMEDAGLSGIATFVMRTREYLVAIMAEDGILRAETMRWAGEVRVPKEVGLPRLAKPKPAEVKALDAAIRRLEQAELDERELVDPRTAALAELVAAKVEEGRDVVEVPEEATATSADDQIIDLMAVLKRSLEGEGAARRSPGRAPRRGAHQESKAEELTGLSKGQLYERAQALGIEGRSAMTKPQLIAAIRKAG